MKFRIGIITLCSGALLATLLYLYQEVYVSLGESKEVASLATVTTPLTLNIEKFERILKMIVAKQALEAKENIPDPFASR